MGGTCFDLVELYKLNLKHINMSIIKTNKASFPSLLNDILNTDWYGGYETGFGKEPLVNISENTENYQLELLVPGRKKEHFNIEVDEGQLIVSAEDNTHKSGEVKYTRKEFGVNAFKRVFVLPESVNQDDIKASYEDGVLTFVLPVKEEALPKPKRTISLV